MSKTGVIWDERYLNHLTGEFHPESPARLLAIKEVLDADSALVHLLPRSATDSEILLVHTAHHLEEVRKAREGFFDLDTPYSLGSSTAAFLAAGGVLKALEEIEEKRLSNAFVFPRPPGHHAETNRAMGFCLFNNVAVGAEWLIRQKKYERVAIIDFDVHHGNGTQHFFYDRQNVFYISSHRFPFYPGTGSVEEKGRGEGYGFNLNLPYPALTNDDDLKALYETYAVPALLKYRPQFIIVSAGYDAHIRDPLGGVKISKKGFLKISELLIQVAQKCCEGKIIFVLEGGYDLKGLQEGVEASLTALKG